MSSNKPGTCCYQGVKHEGDPVGTFEQGDAFEYYISEAKDKSTDKGILMLVKAIMSGITLTFAALRMSLATDSTMLN